MVYFFREVIEVFIGVLLFVYVVSSCCCFFIYLKINVVELVKCLKNLEGDFYIVFCLVDIVYLIEFVIDGDILSFWLFEIINNVIIDINLFYLGL